MPNPPLPPEIIFGQSSEQQLARMLAHPALEGMSVAEGSMPHAQLSPVANELAEGYFNMARIVEQRSLIGDPGHCAYGDYLDQIGLEEMGVARQSAVPARISLTFTGTPGTVIPGGAAGDLTACVVQATTDEAPMFRLTADVLIRAAGTGGGIGECEEPGMVGNVPAGTVTEFVGTIPAGVTAVNNDYSQPLVPGTDIESDNDYRLRLLEYRRDPPNGCNAAQFRAWAEAVPGVGKAQVVRPTEAVGPQGQQPPPPGNVYVYCLDENMRAAPQAVVDVVQAVIAPSREIAGGASNFTPNGGAVVEADGTIRLPLGGVASGATGAFPSAEAEIPGVWMWRPSLRVSNQTTDPLPICTVEVFNVTINGVAPGAPPPNPDGRLATLDVFAADLRVAFPGAPEVAPSIDVWWNSVDVLELRVRRLATQQVVDDLWFEGGWIRSAFSAPEHEGLAPVDDRVECYVPTERPIEVVVTVQGQVGWNPPDVEASVRAALTEYLKEIAFTTGTYMDDEGRVKDIPVSNDVAYGAVAAAIQLAPGVEYYDPGSLTINGNRLNIEIWKGDCAVLGNATIITVIPAARTGWQVIGPPGTELP